jgi:hypothetical protein
MIDYRREEDFEQKVINYYSNGLKFEQRLKCTNSDK